MKKILSVLFGLLLLATTAVSGPSHPKLLDSVRPLGLWQDQSIRNICTVTSINPYKMYWLTAAHCVVFDAEMGVYALMVEEKPNTGKWDLVVPVVVDVENDVAILEGTALRLPAVKLATKAPTYLDPITVAGHPYGWAEPIIVQGIVSGPSNTISDEPGFNRPFMIFQVPIAPGNSGSSVVNSRGEIVSVVQIGFGGFQGLFSPGGGITFDVLKEYRSYWDER